MILKMIQNLRNKLEAKIDKLQETLNEEIEDLKIKQAEMQNTITKIKSHNFTFKRKTPTEYGRKNK